MPYYHYRALTPGGELEEGRRYSHNRQQLRHELRARHLHPLHVGRVIRIRPRLPLAAQTLLLQQLAQLLAAGLPLLTAIHALRTQPGTPALRPHLAQVEQHLAEGSVLSHSLQLTHTVSDAVALGLIRHGEHHGHLATGLSAAAGHLAATLDWQRRLRRLLVYPLLVLLACGLAGALALAQVIPAASQLLTGLGMQSLPWTTRALLAIRDLGHTLTPLHLLVLPGVWLLMHHGLTRSASWHERLRLSWPVFGRIRHQLLLARSSRMLAMLYRQGELLDRACMLSADSLPAGAWAHSWRSIGQQLAQGHGLASACRQIRLHGLALFPPLWCAVIEHGELAGCLDDALLQAADYCQQDADHRLAQCQQLAEPILTLVAGGILMLIISGVMDPVYQLSAQLGGGWR